MSSDLKKEFGKVGVLFGGRSAERHYGRRRPTFLIGAVGAF